MMMAMEATSTVLDRSLEKLKTTPRADEPRRASMADKWAIRRWSLRGTADTRAKSTPPPPPPQVSPSPVLTAQSETETEKRKRSRSVDLSPLQTSLKKAPTVITAKLAQCVESLGFRDALHRYKSSKKHADDDDDDHPFPHHPHHDSKDRRVHFPSSAAHFKQVFERPETTAEEKAQYHYSRQELTDMVIDAKHSLARETRFSAQPDSTILEQGFLTLPNELHFFHHKRYYCLLKARELLCFASPAHAAKQTHVKCKIPILKVQECSTMSAQAKIAAFGAHLPTTMSLLFFVTRADGERVLLAAETRSSKKNWVHILQRLTQVHEAALPACVVRQTSSTSTCTSEDDSNNSLCSSDDEEEKCETPETNEREENKADEKAAAREGCCDCHHTEEPVCCQ